MNLNSKIGLGTVQFGLDYGISNNSGKTPSEEVKKILEFALSQGIDTIDTASAYGDAEKVLGENNLSRFRVISKFLPPENGESVTTQFYNSLERLKQNSLYGYLAHRPLDVLNNLSQWEELKIIREKGLVKKIGFSFNEPSEITLLTEAGCFPDLIQIPYNYFDQRFEKQIIELKENNCEIHTRSTFLQGLFFMDADNLSSYFDEVKPIIKDLQNSNKKLAGSLLKFAAQQPFIDKVIIGVENIDQLKMNLVDMESSDMLNKLKREIPENIIIPYKWPKN